jgi:hypothetical protein
LVGPVNVDEYNSLTKEERAKLIHEFEEDKAMKAKGHISLVKLRLVTRLIQYRLLKMK